MRIRATALLSSALKGWPLVLLVLGGCATLNESECRSVDWRTIGYEDGARGYSGERIGQHRKACAKYGVTPDFNDYRSGRDAGLREYCQPANAFHVGVAGSSYSGVCPADLEHAFADAYDAGRHLYDLRSRISEIAGQLDARHHELDGAEEQLARSSAAVISSETAIERRAQALVDAKQLAEKVGRLKADIHHLEQERVHADRDLEDYRATLRYAE